MMRTTSTERTEWSMARSVELLSYAVSKTSRSRESFTFSRFILRSLNLSFVVSSHRKRLRSCISEGK